MKSLWIACFMSLCIMQIDGSDTKVFNIESEHPESKNQKKEYLIQGGPGRITINSEELKSKMRQKQRTIYCVSMICCPCLCPCILYSYCKAMDRLK